MLQGFFRDIAAVLHVFPGDRGERLVDGVDGGPDRRRALRHDQHAAALVHELAVLHGGPGVEYDRALRFGFPDAADDVPFMPYKSDCTKAFPHTVL